MARTTFNGKVIDDRTAAQLREVEKITGRRLVLTQGSWSTSTPQSAGTHAGGGAFDVRVADLTKAQRDELVIAMRKVGIAFWIRQPDEGDWPLHGHGVSIGCVSLSDAAENQVADYLAGLNGLANDKRDPHAGLKVRPTTWEKYLAAEKPPVPDSSFAVPRTLRLDEKPNSLGIYAGSVGRALRLHGVGATVLGAKKLQRRLGARQTGKLTRDQIAYLAERFNLNTK